MTRHSIRLIFAGLAAAWALAGAASPAWATTYTPLLSDTTYRDTDPAPSPDGKWLAYQSNRGGRNQIWLLPLAGGESHALTAEPESSAMHSGVRVMTPTWTPDGKTVLFVSTRSGQYNIYSIPVEGGDAKALSNAPGSQRFPSCSMNGQKIVFPSSRLAPTELYGFSLYVMDAKGEIDGPPAKRITYSNGSPGHPIWSPDGKWVGYVAKDVDTTRTISLGKGMETKESAMFARFRVYKMPAEGGKEIQLTGLTPEKQPSEDTWPSWSPDGKWIAFGRNIGGKANVWVIDVATKRAFPITRSDNAMKPTWSYDGKAIYYAVLNGKDEDLWVATDLTLKPPATAAPKKKSTTTKSSGTKASTSSTTAK